MKKIITLILFVGSFGLIHAQTLTYAVYSNGISAPSNVKIASLGSFNASILSISGTGVTWDASGLSQQGGTPVLHLQTIAASTAPHGALFPSATDCEYDPANLAIVGETYYGLSSDSLVQWGTWPANDAHELMQDPDKRLIFPFNYGTSFSNSYAKTNYSDSLTVSSYQTGTRTVQFSGYGTLILPQGSFDHVALIYEVRTNNLGPSSTTYSWTDLDDGKKLLYHEVNDGNTIVVYTDDQVTGIKENAENVYIQLYPNPASENLFIQSQKGIEKVSCTNLLGEAELVELENKTVNIASLAEGVHFLSIQFKNGEVSTQRFVKASK